MAKCPSLGHIRSVTDAPRSPVPADWLESVAVFPLPQVVFFPGTTLPLHLFEPRYRAMMAECLRSGNMTMAVTQLKPGFEANYQGSPPIRTICGLGRIEQHEALPDGRFNLVLKGLCRVELEELEPGEAPYRRAKAMVLQDRATDQVRPEAVAAMMSTATQVASMIRRSYPEFELGVSNDSAPGRLVDTLTDRLIGEPEIRQTLLEESSVPARVAMLTDKIASLWAQLSHDSQTSSGGGTLH